MALLAPLRPLSMVLKAFLQQRELNEVRWGVLMIACVGTHVGALVIWCVSGREWGVSVGGGPGRKIRSTGGQTT